MCVRVCVALQFLLCIVYNNRIYTVLNIVLWLITRNIRRRRVQISLNVLRALKSFRLCVG